MIPQPLVLNERFRILERAGSGGMAVVYKAQDLALGRLVAVKILQESLTEDSAFLARFRQEAQRAANLAHPNIVTVHDIGQDGRRHFIVMEFVEGRTLKRVLRDHQVQTGRSLPIDRVLDLVIQVCAGIGYAHRAGLVHCDVKPQNVLVTRDERVKVADFGIAQAVSQGPAALQEQVWGTPQYLSPEQATGEPATPASDVYAIGVILFELLAGRTPFQAESLTRVAEKHVWERPPRVSSFNPAVPPPLDLIIEKVLAKEPAGRYRTADQLGRILQTYRDNSLEITGAARPVGRSAGDPGDTRASRPPGAVPLSERRTAYYEPDSAPTPPRPRRPVAAPVRGATGARPAPRPAPPLRIVAPPDPEAPDWTALGLAFLALLALLGLIPLWALVYLRWAG